MTKLFSLLLFASALIIGQSGPAIDEINAAVRADDLTKIHALIPSRREANTASSLKNTPLHYAATYGSVEALRFLLDRGADPNAKNQAGVTPLVLAAWNFERTRLLVEHGAAVNVATNQGITALIVAASAHGNLATVRYLLDKGADLHARNDDGEDALLRTAFSGDADMLELLLDRGGDPKTADKGGATALMNAASYPDARRIRLLLAAGANPNALNTFAGQVKNGPIALTHMSALMYAAPFSDEETITALLKAGARVNEKDTRGMTPLMLSIATDSAQPATVRRFIAAGADVQAKDNNGDSALDWAHKFNNPEIVALLAHAGAEGRSLPPAPVPPSRPELSTPVESVNSALSLMARSDFFRMGGGCAGCHHQPMYARAYAVTRNLKQSPDAGLRTAFLDATVANRPRFAAVLPFLTSFGGDADTICGIMAANADLNEPASQWSDMMVHFLEARQDPSGAWIFRGIARPPLEESTISRTAIAAEILSVYSLPARQAEFESHIQKAKTWLLTAIPETTYEHADRIRGLHAVGMSASALQPDVDRLLKLQRQDGGWSQTKYLQSDAYATGLVLETLYRTGSLRAEDPAYQRGIAFLLRTQFPDGSWYVRSRAPKFQPYFQSGLPFDHDQWISSAGTAWAAMAVSHALTSAIASR